MSMLTTPNLSQWTTPDLLRFVIDGTLAPLSSAPKAAPIAVATPAPLTTAGYTIDGFAVAADSESGDILDWTQVGASLRFTLGDVMGKGSPAASTARTLRTAIAAHHKLTPGAVLTAVNTTTGMDLRAVESFATLIHGSIDITSNRIALADAGHGIAVHLTAAGQLYALRSSDLPIGLHGIADTFHEQHIHLERGDALIALTDGFLDLSTGTLADLDFLGALWATSTTTTAFLSALHDHISGAGEPEDDITVITISRT